MESWRWRRYWKGERRLAVTRWNNSTAAGAILQPSGFTPQPPATSNSEPYVVFVSSFILCQCPKTREAERRETCPKCRGPSGVWSADTRRVGGCEGKKSHCGWLRLDFSAEAPFCFRRVRSSHQQNTRGDGHDGSLPAGGWNWPANCRLLETPH